METISALHLPDTHPNWRGLYPLLCLYDSLIQLIPAEDCLQPEHFLVQNNLLIQETPVPFGKELAKFNQLIRDIQRHSSDFYGSSFSSLSLKDGPIHADEGSVLSLIAQMKSSSQGTIIQEQEEILLQARLLLKLTEIHEQEENELQTTLRSLNHKKAQLFSTLKGEEDFTDLTEEKFEYRAAESPLRLKQRLKAWSYLLLASKPGFSWLTSTTADVFDFLKETAEELAQPTLICTLSLAQVQPQSESIKLLCDFHKHSQTIRQTLATDLKAVAETGRVPRERTFHENISSWETALNERDFPPGPEISFYLFSKPLENLLTESLNLTNFSQKKSIVPNTVLGVLQ